MIGPPMTVYVVATIGIALLWLLAIAAVRRIVLSRLWIAFDVAIGVVVGLYLTIDGRPLQGLALALALVPLLILFSAFRTVQMHYIERKTQAILDNNPAMRDAYDRRSTPSRSERKASRDE